MEYQSPGAALSEGFQSGLGLAAKYSQIKAERDKATWERQLQTAEMGMKLVENKNLPEPQRISAFNKGVRPVLTRMGMDMPEMTSATIKSDSFQEAIKNSNGIIDQMQAGKVDPHVGFNAIQQHFTGALKDMQAETEAQKTQRELVIGNANKYVDQADKADAHTTDKTTTPAEAIDKQSELQFKLAKLNTSNLDSQIMADAMNQAHPGSHFEPGKISQADVDMVKAGVRKSLSYYNQFLPDEYRHKEGITMAEAKALKEKGFSTDRMARDFTVTDAPDGMDPLAMHIKRKAGIPIVAPSAVAPIPMPPGAGAAPAPNPVTPPPLAPPAPMAAPAPVPLPTAGPLSLSGGATQASPSAYPLPAQQSLQ